MRRFGQSAVGVLRGAEILFSAFEDDGPMWTGEGTREHRHQLQFSTAFLEGPVIHVGLSMWDIDGSANQRVDISAEEIGPGGFTIVFRTWGDTRVARVRAEWLAIGPVGFDEDWEI